MLGLLLRISLGFSIFEITLWVLAVHIQVKKVTMSDMNFPLALMGMTKQINGQYSPVFL